ncbi:MAG: CoA-acylating methylmalonate-semialdehyde dehydrogenase [Gammaproteobacteria bacterium]|nr:CoA-acylating methylmalonate-semialdehyde dehydrogenase [Gammaproteobacteria bacterium]MYC24354.1 CoA-acylating methylmalonate-semialdehyde dehydrogenase [Gammaproteobacteria bacterium]
MYQREPTQSTTTATIGHFIGGKVIHRSGRTLPIEDPATGSTIRVAELADSDTVDEAVNFAQKAFSEWRATTPLKRARVMFKFKQLLEENADEICKLITEEHGKTLEDARGELQRGIEVVEYACGIPELLKGEHTPSVGTNIDSWSQFQPLGVSAGITPFNFPAMVPMWMYPIAIACGNAFVLKPSELDPSASMFCATLLRDAGLPDGVFNIVNGDRETVDALLANPIVQSISFVGSTPVAEHVYVTGTKNGKRVQALGGAKNHAIVMPDADMDQAANATLGAAYGSCGERCMAISVVVCVGEETASEFISNIQQGLNNLTVDSGFSSDSDMGPLISDRHLERVRDYIELGVDEGAELVVDGRNLVVSGHEKGHFLGPCLFDRVNPSMRIYQDEIFGPVLCVVRAHTQEEAMAIVDEHPYGNGTCIFTRDGEAARFFAENIKVGMVGINVPLPVPAAVHSFGGWKRSLFGDLYAYGPDAVKFYTRRKTITERWPSGGVREQARFSFPS